jgi:ABC-type Fe3+/spermidine/putrescine transport system ATPase subunit
MEALRLQAVTRSFGGGPPAVNEVDLTIEAGKFFCLLGPSGCGKTTLLRLIGGYLAPDRGRILLAGQDITNQPLERRNIGMVFQNYALFPHLSARGNVAFGLEMRRLQRSEVAKRVEAILERVGLSAAERERRPRELSGGQQQRVALARALVIQPDLLLLDEPLANLDRQLREQLRAELKEIQRRTGVTTIFVTHDMEEALSLADRVGLMLAGRLLQVDTPRDLYERPRTPFVARFGGQANLFEVVEVAEDSIQLRGGLRIGRAGLSPVRKGGWLLARPESLVIGPGAAACPNTWTGRVRGSTFLGADQLLDVVIAPLVVRARCRPGAMPDWQIDEELTVGIPAGALWAIPESDPPWLAALKLEAANHAAC